MEIKVLFVDDDREMKFLILKKFQQEIASGKIIPHFAHNGREALSLLAKHPNMDIVFTDIDMPLMDGIALLRLSYRFFAHIPFVVLSAYDGGTYQALCKELGARAFLRKPSSFTEIEKILKMISDEKNAAKICGRICGSPAAYTSPPPGR
jgi:CheY-like chemotaxis protein